MPQQPPAPKRAPAVPLGGSMGHAFPGVPSLPAKTRTAVRTDAEVKAHADLVTRYYFYAFMVLNLLGIAAVGYALLSM